MTFLPVVGSGGLGFRGFGFRIWGLKLRVSGLGFSKKPKTLNPTTYHEAQLSAKVQFDKVDRKKIVLCMQERGKSGFRVSV